MPRPQLSPEEVAFLEGLVERLKTILVSGQRFDVLIQCGRIDRLTGAVLTPKVQVTEFVR